MAAAAAAAGGAGAAPAHPDRSASELLDELARRAKEDSKFLSKALTLMTSLFDEEGETPVPVDDLEREDDPDFPPRETIRADP